LDETESHHAIVSTHDGTYYSLELSKSPALAKIGSIPFTIRANAILASVEKDNFTLIQVTECGKIIRINMISKEFRYEIITALTYANNFSPSGLSNARLFATPLVSGDLLYVGYVRQTYFPDPPVACVDVRSGSVLWHAAGTGESNVHFGNCRTTPLLVDESLILALAYSDQLIAISAVDGLFSWGARAGASLFQQWASPVLAPDGGVLVGRVDGVLSKISVASRALQWSVSLAPAEPEKIRSHKRGHDFWRNATDGVLMPGSPPTGGICSTPAISGSRIFCGTTNGILVCIDDDPEVVS
jgi:outer membrane protein assembly factor BamB